MPTSGLNLPIQTFTSSPTGFSGTVTIDAASYELIDKQCFVEISFSGTSNATTCTFTLPVASASLAAAQYFIVRSKDNGLYSAGLLQILAGASTASLYSSVGGNSFTASGSKGLAGATFSYFVA